MFISEHLPPAVGYKLADVVAQLFAWLKPDVYWIVYDNLRQVLGPRVAEGRLHRLTHRVFCSAARNDYALWHLIGRGREAIGSAVHFPSEVWSSIDQAIQRGRGAIIAGAHTGGFDLSLMSLAAQGLNLQVLGLASPPTGGFDLLDQMRARAGLHLTSIGVSALRQAIHRLRGGGLVATGVDRPVSAEGRGVEFFGRPAPLPVGHVRLALRTDAAILVAAPYRDPQKGNLVRISPPLEMVRPGNEKRNLQVNLRRVTAWLEKFIRACPDQWAMFVPVWP